MTGLSGGDLDVVISALDDAAAYRRDAGDCSDCSKQPEGQCADHDSDEAAARAYGELADRLEAQLRERAPAAVGVQRDAEAGS